MMSTALNVESRRGSSAPVGSMTLRYRLPYDASPSPVKLMVTLLLLFQYDLFAFKVSLGIEW